MGEAAWLVEAAVGVWKRESVEEEVSKVSKGAAARRAPVGEFRRSVETRDRGSARLRQYLGRGEALGHVLAAGLEQQGHCAAWLGSRRRSA